MAKRFLKGASAPYMTVTDDPIMPTDVTNKKYVDARCLPTGGLAGQVAEKVTDSDFDVSWAHPVRVYDPNGKLVDAKVWTGKTVTDNEGRWTINYNNAGFSEWVRIQAQAVSNSNILGNMNIATVVGDPTLTSATGYSVESNSITSRLFNRGGQGLEVSGSGVRIDVTIIGV